MDGIRYMVFTDQSIPTRCTSNVKLGSTRTKIKRWVKHLFGVKVIAMNSHRLRGKDRRMESIMGHKMHYRCKIIALQLGYFIPPLRKKRT